MKMEERELQQTQLHGSEQFVSEFQQSQQQNEKTIADFQQTISDSARERKIQQPEQQDTASNHQSQQQPVTTPHTTVAAAPKDISDMTWRERKNAPEKMCRGAAVVHENTAYFRSADSKKIYSYQNIHGQEQWSELPDNPNQNCFLAVIDGLFTSVGGFRYGFTNTLLSLTGEGERKEWSEIFPPMLTPRTTAACVTTEQVLIVAGGYDGSDLATVEVMNISKKQWTTVSPLPQKQSQLSGIVCGDTLYVAGGCGLWTSSKSVFACSLPDLLTSSNSLGFRIRRSLSQRGSVWKKVSSLPVVRSTLASFNGHLLAIGGRDDSGSNLTTNVYGYDPHTDSWNVVSQMKIKRSDCLTVTLPEDCLIVVGGQTQGVKIADSVEILY